MKREVIIPFRVSAREKEELEKKAAACGWSLSDYIRACISATPVTVIEGADALTDELRRIGNNLNQLTRHANTGFVDVVDLRETRREVARIWQSLNSLCQGAR